MNKHNDNPYANPPERARVIKRHGLFTRVWHWVNLVCLVILLMSGLQIFNAHPALYWGNDSSFDDPALQITAMRGDDGAPMGVVRIGGYRINTTGVLGLSRNDGELDTRAFPAWATLPGPQWLAMGRYWHFAAAWVFAPLLLAYLVYTLISPARRRLVWPTAAQWRGLPATIAHHARLKFDHSADYNGLQKLTYLLVLFGLLPLMVLTGLTMSPTMNAAWPWLLDVFGGRQSARTLHFIFAFLLVAFFVIHLGLVLISGVFNNLRSMITGRYRLGDDAPADKDNRHA
ncbi:HupC [Salinisphaera orenii MK-B5]|uniref:HupC n=1 Tax=Salinisphaera orenii MK-B5 TaxID=856730 RepID=A0A423PT23_9GAMM|nr:cytochrome b/b6 domain-containing protein [Salinisphaera orenii]ROO28743.1 HupC [Salinisphaera orenii MK-B5]